MRRALQHFFLIACLVSLGFSSLVTHHWNQTSAQARAARDQLENLKNAGKLSYDEVAQVRQSLEPLIYPNLHAPWLLRWRSALSSGFLLGCLLVKWWPAKKRSDDTNEGDDTQVTWERGA